MRGVTDLGGIMAPLLYMHVRWWDNYDIVPDDIIVPGSNPTLAIKTFSMAGTDCNVILYCPRQVSQLCQQNLDAKDLTFKLGNYNVLTDHHFQN